MADLMIRRLCMKAARYVSCALQLFVSDGALQFSETQPSGHLTLSNAW